MMANRSDKAKGIVSLIVAAFGFAVMSMFVKLTDGRVPTIQMVLFRNAISMIVAFTMVVIHKERFYGKRENQRLLLMRSFFGTIGMLLFFYSISNLNIADANMLNKLSTFFLILFSAIFLSEKVKTYQVVAIVVAFLGSLLIIKPSFDFVAFPYITSVLAAMFAGAAYTVLRALGEREQYYTIVLYFSTFSVVTLSLGTIFILQPLDIFHFVPMNSIDIYYLIAAGFFATIGQFGTTLAYKFAPARDISIFNYTNVIFAALISMFVFQTIPDIYSVIGYVVIFTAAYYMFKKK